MDDPRARVSPPALVPIRRIPGDEGEGVLAVPGSGADVRFQVRRVYWVSGMARGRRRGGHAHRRLEQLFVCVQGRFGVVLKTGTGETRYEIAEGGDGLYLPPMTWIEYTAGDDGAIALVLASELYDEADYIRDWRRFVREAVDNAR